MKRREFVIRATSAAGLAFAETVKSAIPCPPILGNATNGQEVCPRPAGPSGLADQAAQLNPGEWLNSISLPSAIEQFDISWQNRTAFWDDVHGEIQFMGKAQGGGSAKHWIYSETSNAWRQSSGDVAPGKLGHVWQVTFDHTDDPGDYYFVEQDVGASPQVANTIRHMDRSLEDGQGSTNAPWRLLTRAPFEVWEPTDTPNPGLGYHPNLLGPGRPGIFCWGTTDFSFWDKNNNSWRHVDSFGLSAPYGDRNQNSSLYVPGHDLLIFGSSVNQSQQALIIPAGYSGDTTPVLEDLPIRVHNHTRGGAHLLIDPTDDSRIMLLERDGSRVWTNADGGRGASWRLESFTHPFWNNLPVDDLDGGSWTPCSIPSYGVVLGMASYGSAANNGANGTIMWRPGTLAA